MTAPGLMGAPARVAVPGLKGMSFIVIMPYLGAVGAYVPVGFVFNRVSDTPQHVNQSKSYEKPRSHFAPKTLDANQDADMGAKPYAAQAHYHGRQHMPDAANKHDERCFSVAPTIGLAHSDKGYVVINSNSGMKDPEARGREKQ